MPFDARAVANYFLDKAAQEGMPLDHMKLQKLVYIAHGWHLAITGRPLVFNRIEAWPYGPVIPDLYHEFKTWGTATITGRALEADPFEDVDRPYALEGAEEANDTLKTTCAILDRVWERYKEYGPLQLSAMTHQEGTPWHEKASNLPPSQRRKIPIQDELIRRHYVELANRKRAHAS